MTKAHDDRPLAVEYWHQSARPLVSLVFILPMLLGYEFGIVVLGPDAVHNGAAVWLQQALGVMGLGQYVLLPVLTCAILLGWHYTTRQSWRFSPLVPMGMLLESMLLAALLLMIFRAYSWVAHGVSQSVSLLAMGKDAGQLVGYFGAGIYEELLFRLVLLSAIAAVIRWAGAEKRPSWIAAILVSSVIFAAAHYQIFTSGGEPFAFSTFFFRVVAGIYFAVVFVMRGFGVAAGTHAIYDILVFLRWL